MKPMRPPPSVKTARTRPADETGSEEGERWRIGVVGYFEAFVDLMKCLSYQRPHP